MPRETKSKKNSASDFAPDFAPDFSPDFSTLAPFCVACVQMNATADRQDNIDAITKGLQEAAQRGADVVALPENAGGMGADPMTLAGDADHHPVLSACRSLAARLHIRVLVGSLAILRHDRAGENGPPLVNRGFWIDRDGAILCHYDKIHLFDADPPGGEKHRESDLYHGGDKAVIAPTPWGGWGMTICYDLRFPGLYRALAKGGAGYIGVPSAFTYSTGKAHWSTLVRARAIENGCFIIAPAQCGHHGPNRRTWGESMIVDPWGNVLARAGRDAQVISAIVDPRLIDKARRAVGALYNECDFK